MYYVKYYTQARHEYNNIIPIYVDRYKETDTDRERERENM